jgi:hypothetical protein
LTGCDAGARCHGDSRRGGSCKSKTTKKANVAEHPEVFDHIGLLFNEPPGMAGLFFI